MKKLKKHNLYKIHWIDIETFNQWFDEEEAQEKLNKDEVVTNVGFYYGEDKSFLYFSPGICKKQDGKYQYCNLDKFPKGCIVQIQKL